jgi:hypothetical protein
MQTARRLLRWSAAPAGAVLLSCSTPVCACPPAMAHGVVYGTVRDAAGWPVAGALVQGTVYGRLCGEGFAEPFPHPGPLAAGGDGAYRLYLHTPLFGPQAACVMVAGVRPDLSGRVEALAALALRHEREAPDSVRVDLVLQ